MVEQARTLPVTVATTSYNQYPAPVAKYEEVITNPRLFMTSLEKLHSVMGTKFMIPIIGGKELDLHKLFVEVTSRGGVEKILREKRWKEVATTFNFPSTATNASFVLRKYYFSLLQHYEQIYYFKVQGWCSSTGGFQGSNAAPGVVYGLPVTPSTPSQAPNLANIEQTQIQSIPEVAAAGAASIGTPITGVIDGKFDSGYLVTVKVGKDTLKGVLYHSPPPHIYVSHGTHPSNISIANNNSTLVPGLSRKRKRRKKSELRKRDPSHPKPNRSGYNFFFAEQHAKLRALHPGKDREISRKIGELWNNLQDNGKTVYQEKAVKDKERYKMEMEEYREKLNEKQVISDAVPLQQRFPHFNINMAGVGVKDETQRNLQATPENDSEFSKSETEEDDESFSDTEASLPVGASHDFQIVQEDDKPFEESDVSFGDGSNVPGGAEQNLPPEPQS